MVVCTPAPRHTLIHIHLLDFNPFLNICKNEGVLYKDRGGDSIYYNLLEPQELTTSYFILMYLHSQPHFFFCLAVARKTSEERNNNGKAGDLVFTVSLTLALSGASISQQIKLPELDCALTGHSETSPGSRRGTMGFCWSGECGNRPCWGGHYMPGWVGPTVLLCIYGFCSMMRPIEPFMTEFLTGTYKNLTTEQVTRQVFPVWSYSSLVLLIPVLLVTDFLRYKPVIILQGFSYVTAFLLILFGSGVRSAQLVFFSFSIALAADVAYFSYIYSVVQPSYYQRVTSYVRGAMLLGYAVGALLSQLLVSFGVSLYCLAVVSLTSVSVALITSFFLPMPKTSLFFKGTYSAQQGSSGEDTHNSESQDFSMWVKITTAAKHVGRMFRGLVLDCAAATIAVGHVSLDWSVWGELVLGGLTFVIAGAILLMDLTDDIWISYACFFLFKTVYMQLSTVCTFQIAKTLKMERYALVFGVNSFVSTILQSVLAAIINNTLQVTITLQFIVYASYFAAISLLFTVRGMYTLLDIKRPVENNQAERATNLPEPTRL
ncbi:thiamine transporter 2-like [Epinephelus lanceolatus]